MRQKQEKLETKGAEMAWSEVLIPAVVFGSIVLIIKIVTDARTRNKLIDQGMVDEKVKYLFAKDIRLQRLSSLKWGLVLVGIGLSLMITYAYPELFDDGGTFGLMFLFAGVAFLIYYAVAQRQLSKTDHDRDQMSA